MSLTLQIRVLIFENILIITIVLVVLIVLIPTKRPGVEKTIRIIRNHDKTSEVFGFQYFT